MLADVRLAHPPARHDGETVPCLGQQRPDLLGRDSVVEHHQGLRAIELGLVERGLSAHRVGNLLSGHAQVDEQLGQRLRDRQRGHVRREPVEPQQELAVRESVAQPVRRFHGQPGLADSGRSADPHRPPFVRTGGGCLDRVQLAGPAGEPSRTRRQRADRVAPPGAFREVAQHRARLDAESGERGGRGVEDPDRADPVAARDQCAHQELGVLLVVRDSTDRAAHPIPRRAVVACVQLQFGQVTERIVVALVRQDHLAAADPVDVDVLQEPPAPQRHCRAQQVDCSALVVVLQGLCGLLAQPVEPHGVDLQLVDAQHVPGRGRLDRRVGGFERGAEPLDVAADQAPALRLVAPHDLGEPFG